MNAKLSLTTPKGPSITFGTAETLAAIAVNALIGEVPKGVKNKRGYVQAHERRLLRQLDEVGHGYTSLGNVRARIEKA